MGSRIQTTPMADFSNSLPDPLEAARRRYGFATLEDLLALDRIVTLAAQGKGGASLCLSDVGGIWYETTHGEMTEPLAERHFTLEGTDLEGILRLAHSTSEEVIQGASDLILEVLKLRRLGAERRRQPRGPEGASFVPGLVHELRNFLFSMGAGLDAFAARFEQAGEKAGADHSDALRRNLTRLQGFMEELGEYGNPTHLAFALGPVIPVVSQSLRLAKPLAESHGVQLLFLEGDATPMERMDRAALEGSLRRLIEMVALETERGGEVRVEARLMNGLGRPWLAVHIAGVPGRTRGLDPDRLFEPFYYRDKDMSRLGIAIARRLIEAHGGQLAAAAGARGLVLRILLPVWMEAP